MKPTEEAIVLAGGFGTRLRAVVSDVPKPLASVAGRPFLAWLLDGLAESGMRRCILATGYLAEQIEAQIGARWRGMDIAYSMEPEPLGTGGAIRLAANRLLGESVHVLNGDTWLKYSPRALETMALDEGVPLAIALADMEDVERYGAVETRARRVVGFLEKGRAGPGWVNAGCYFLGREALEELPTATAFSFEREVLQPWALLGKVGAYTETSGFIDIGVPEDYVRAQSLFAEGA